MQSWNWGEFNKARGEKIWRLGIYDGETLIGVALVIKVRAKRGTFLFVPHGPIQDSKSKILNVLVQKLKVIAGEENCSFVRVSPIAERSIENAGGFKKLGFGYAPIHMHPEATWELDIVKSEEEILAGMRKTTRYLIRQAEKSPDIKIERSTNTEDLDRFQKLYEDTIERHHFIGFPQDYLKNEFLAFSPDNQISLFLGKYKGELFSSAIVIFWQGTAFYHHGASLSSKIPVSYLLQWEIIKEAKRRGCKVYNFWGIAPDDKKDHPWRGLTLFKTGFGGYKKEYLKTQDLPIYLSYWLIYIFEKIRKLKRGL